MGGGVTVGSIDGTKEGIIVGIRVGTKDGEGEGRGDSEGNADGLADGAIETESTMVQPHGAEKPCMAGQKIFSMKPSSANNCHS